MTDRFLRACRRELVDRTPIWFMRQAGRYMPEYRALRAKHSLIELCRAPELAAEVTLQPVARLGVDAAILFSDLLLPLVPMGLAFDFMNNEGPVFRAPIRSAEAVNRLQKVDPAEHLGFVLEAIRLLRRALDGRVPLIGFAGAPFTLASYAIEGGHSSAYARTKALMYGEPRVWHKLCSLFADVIREYLVAQIEAGAQAVQLFDSWVGVLDAADYREFALPHTRAILEGLKGRGAPVIHFGTGTAAILAEMREAGGDVLGIDWRIGLDEAWRRVGEDVAVQGNLDPAVLLGPFDRICRRADDILKRAAGRPGHIFNLGHGILPGTPVELVKALVEHVHHQTERPEAP